MKGDGKKKRITKKISVVSGFTDKFFTASEILKV